MSRWRRSCATPSQRRDAVSPGRGRGPEVSLRPPGRTRVIASVAGVTSGDSSAEAGIAPAVCVERRRSRGAGALGRRVRGGRSAGCAPCCCAPALRGRRSSGTATLRRSACSGWLGRSRGWGRRWRRGGHGELAGRASRRSATGRRAVAAAVARRGAVGRGARRACRDRGGVVALLGGSATPGRCIRRPAGAAAGVAEACRAPCSGAASGTGSTGSGSPAGRWRRSAAFRTPRPARVGSAASPEGRRA